MITIKTTAIRPDLSVKFYKASEEFLDYRDATYLDTGKILEITNEVSEDGLSKSTVIVFLDQESLDEYDIDSRVIENRNMYRVYCTDAKIKRTTEIL